MELINKFWQSKKQDKNFTLHLPRMDSMYAGWPRLHRVEVTLPLLLQSMPLFKDYTCNERIRDFISILF